MNNLLQFAACGQILVLASPMMMVHFSWENEQIKIFNQQIQVTSSQNTIENILNLGLKIPYIVNSF